MPKIYAITAVHAHAIEIPLIGKQLHLAVLGEVTTTGWTGIRLSPRFYIVPPADGLWDFDLVGDPPSGIVAQVILPVSAQFLGHMPPWCKGVRVHAESNVMEAGCTVLDAKARPAIKPTFSISLTSAIVHQEIASYDDSFQPTGTIHWKNDGPWGTPNPHVEWKKLHHALALTIEGPDEGKIRDCLGKAAAAGVLAAIAAAIATGGLALSAAISAALSALTSCLGDSFSVRIDDESHWIYWDA